MKKIYEHNDKALKSFIVDDHQIDLKEASKEGLVLDITDHIDKSSTILFINTREIKKVMKMIYENYMGIGKYPIGETIGKLYYVSHVKGSEILSDKGNFDIHKYPDGEIIIRIFIKKRICQLIRFKSLNEVLVVDHV